MASIVDPVPLTPVLSRPASARHRWRDHAGLLVATVALLLALFWSDLATLAHIWWTSTTFGHCLFIAPVVAWLVWQRRSGLAELAPVAWLPGLLLVALGGFLLVAR